MSDLEAQVGAILEIMVNASATEMTKVIRDAPQPEVSDNTHGSPDEKVRYSGPRVPVGAVKRLPAVSVPSSCSRC